MLSGVGESIRRRPVLLGCFLAAGAAFSYGTANFLVRQIVTGQASPLATASFSLLFGTFFLLPLSYREIPRLRRGNMTRRGVVFIILAGVFASSAVTSMYTSLSMIPVTVASPIGAIQPLVALALAHFFLQRLERVTLRVVLGAVLVVVGVVLIGISNA